MLLLWIWGIITAISLVVEFLLSKMVTIWFASGGFITLLVVALVPSIHIVWQLIIFAGSSIALLITLRKICLKYLNTDTSNNN